MLALVGSFLAAYPSMNALEPRIVLTCTAGPHGSVDCMMTENYPIHARHRLTSDVLGLEVESDHSEGVLYYSVYLKTDSGLAGGRLWGARGSDGSADSEVERLSSAIGDLRLGGLAAETTAAPSGWDIVAVGAVYASVLLLPGMLDLVDALRRATPSC